MFQFRHVLSLQALEIWMHASAVRSQKSTNEVIMVAFITDIQNLLFLRCCSLVAKNDKDV